MSDHAHENGDGLARASSAPRTRPGARPTSSHSSVLHLNQMVGNRAVASLLGGARPGSGSGLALQRDAAPVADPTGLAAVVSAEPLARVNQAELTALAQLSAAGTARRTEVESSFGAASQQVGQSFRTFDAQAAAGQATESASVEATGAAATSSIKQQAAASESEAQDVTARRESASSAAAAQEAGRARSEAARHQASAVPPVPGAPDEEVVQGQQKIAAAVEGKARTELVKAGDQAAAGVTAGQQQLRSELYGPAKADTSGKIKTAATQAGHAMDGRRSAARTTVRQLTDGATTQGHHAESTMTQAIASGRLQATKDIAAWEEAGRQKIVDAAEQFRGHILAGAQQFEADALAAQPGTKTLDEAKESVTEALGAGADSMVAALTESAAGLEAGLSELTDHHNTAVAASGQQSQQKVGELAQAVRSGQQQASRDFRTKADAAVLDAGAEFAAVPTRLDAQLAGPHQIALDGMRGKADEAGAKASEWAGQARSAGERGSSDLDSAASSLAHQASQHQPQVQGWFGELVGGMRRWLKDKLGNVLGGIVSGIILALPAIAVTAALLLAGPVGWVALAGLLVVGAALGVYSRWKEYQADHGGQGPGGWDAVGVVALGIADITGIPYIVEAGVGRRAFSLRPMSEFERWERGTEGVIFLALMVAGGAKKLFGRGPVEAPSVRPEVTPEVTPDVKPEVKPETGPAETAEPGGPKPFDPNTAAFPEGTAYEKFQWVKQHVLEAPPGQRLQTARILLGRMPAETGNAWSATENPATNGTYWTGEKQANIFFIDKAGNVYTGKAGVQTFSYGPDGVTVNADSLRPAAPAPPAPAQAPPAPPAPPPPAPQPATVPPTPGAPPVRPGIPLPTPPVDDRDDVFQ